MTDTDFCPIVLFYEKKRKNTVFEHFLLCKLRKEHRLKKSIKNIIENGDIAIAVEIKAKPYDDDVKEHIERMEKLRRYANKRNDSRPVLLKT